MNKRRIIIYLALIALTFIFVKVKQSEITAKRNIKIISTFSEWKEKGKPVSIRKLAESNVEIRTKITVVKLDGVNFAGYVPQNIHAKLKIGQPLYVNFGGEIIKGKIAEVGVEIEMDTGMYLVKVLLEKDIAHLGQAVIAYVTVETLPNVLCVPNNIINKEGDKNYLWVVEDGLAHKRGIVVINSNGYGSIVAAGLKPGELIVLEGFTQLLENDKVSILNKI